MKRTVKKTSTLPENLIEHEETKGKNISIYLNAESLQYLDQLCKLFNAGRSEVIQDMILRTKKASLQLIPLLSNDKSPLAEMIRKIAGVKE
jgi:hypothetical protein